MAEFKRRPIRFDYDERKAGELAACLLGLAGGSMPLLKLLKLMYLADRASLIETGFPITGDAIVAMDKGPVLSKTYDRLKPTGSLPFVHSEPGNVTVDAALPVIGRLSEYELDLANRIFMEFGQMSGDQLIKHLHRAAPEWEPPPPKTGVAMPAQRLSVYSMPPGTEAPVTQMGGTSVPIDPASILRAAGKSDEEIEAVAEQAAYFASINRYRG